MWATSLSCDNARYEGTCPVSALYVKVGGVAASVNANRQGGTYRRSLKKPASLQRDNAASGLVAALSSTEHGLPGLPRGRVQNLGQVNEPNSDRILFPTYQSAPGYTYPVLKLDGPMETKIQEAIRREGREIISALKNHRKRLRDRLLAVQQAFCGSSSKEETFRLVEKRVATSIGTLRACLTLREAPPADSRQIRKLVELPISGSEARSPSMFNSHFEF